MQVKHILQTKDLTGALTIKAGAKINEAAAIMSEKRIGALVVSESGTTVDGILSERDIVRELGKSGAGCLGDTVSSLMTKTVIACRPDEKVISLMAKMTKGRFRHIPVVEDNALIGVVSIGDVVKARIEAIEQENAALTDMIHGNV